MRRVKITVPEGSILNCRYPAACGAAPRIGNVLVSTVCEGAAKMLYASGRSEDVNGSTTGDLEFVGGPGYFYGGPPRAGVRGAPGVYAIHRPRLGAGASPGAGYNAGRQKHPPTRPTRL